MYQDLRICDDKKLKEILNKAFRSLLPASKDFYYQWQVLEIRYIVH